MGRCGACSSTCACNVQGTDGITVTGNGSADSPFIATLTPGTGTDAGCEEVMDCVGSNLGDGLTYNDTGNTLDVELSTDSGNVLAFGTDDGLYLGIGSESNACTAVMTCVAGNVDDTLAYNTTTGELGAAISTQAGNQLTLGNDGALYAGDGADPQADCFRTVDQLPDTGILGGNVGSGDNISPYNTIRAYERGVAAGLDLMVVNPVLLADGTLVIAPYAAFASKWTADPATPPARTYGMLTLSQWKSLTDNVSVWYGMGEQNTQGAATVTDVMDVAGGRAVLLYRTNSTAVASALVDLLASRCLTDSSIISTTSTDVVTIVTAAGIPAAMQVSATTMATLTPDALTAAGATWAVCTGGGELSAGQMAVADVQTYVDAGLNTLMFWVASRYSHANYTSGVTGLRGVVSQDPLYTVNDQTRLTPMVKDPWMFAGNPSGQFGARTQTLGYYRGVRGSRHSSGNGWQMQAETTMTRSAILLGEFAPLPDPTAYTVTWDMTYQTKPSTSGSYQALVIGAPDDRPQVVPVGANPDNPTGNTWGSGYQLRFYANGRLMITKVTEGKYSNLTAITTPTTVLAGTWYSFKAEVTASKITFSKTSGTAASTSTTDTAFRGDYMHFQRWQDETTASRRFIPAIRNLTIA